MTSRITNRPGGGPGGRLATSAQSPRATSTRAARAPSQQWLYAIGAVLLSDTSGALREGLRCSPAPRLLPQEISDSPQRKRTIL